MPSRERLGSIKLLSQVNMHQSIPAVQIPGDGDT